MNQSIFHYKTIDNNTIISNWNKKMAIPSKVFFKKSKDLGLKIRKHFNDFNTVLWEDKLTHFTFRIDNLELSDYEIDKINRNSSELELMNTISEIKEKGGHFKFIKNKKCLSQNNFILIDSLLPEILAIIILHHFSSENFRLIDLINLTEEENPLNFDNKNGHRFYEYKIKRFLTSISRGMVPNKVWDGHYDATYGYIIVKDNGDIIQYDIYTKSQFENNLIYNVTLKMANSNIVEFGKIYQKSGQLYINLNLQIRFI